MVKLEQLNGLRGIGRLQPVATGFYIFQRVVKKQNNIQQRHKWPTKAKMFPFLPFYRSFAGGSLNSENQELLLCLVDKIPLKALVLCQVP